MALSPDMFAADEAVARFFRSAPAWADDLKLFTTAWLGGVIFFGTLIA